MSYFELSTLHQSAGIWQAKLNRHTFYPKTRKTPNSVALSNLNWLSKIHSVRNS